MNTTLVGTDDTRHVGMPEQFVSKMSSFRQRSSAKPGQAAPLDSLRLRIYLSVYPFGFVALCIITITEYIWKLASPIQLIAHPLLIVLFTFYGVILYLRRSWLRLLEIASFVTVALYMLTELYALLYQIYFHGGSQALTTFPQWLPMIYILAFLMFETRTAVVLSVGFLLLAVLPTAVYVLLYGVGGLRNEAFLPLFQIYFSHATYIPLLSGISLIKERYVRAATFAQSMVQLANRDYLTNTDSRRYLEQTLTLALERTRRYNRSLMVLVIDIDYFKWVNDTYG
ncbi:MAG TPA: diguanylate cyclase, partial [Roseiflexaceae bacterium]|nr:diguanylate cyclase [Roseiflexaceae bacterium]